MAVTGRLAVAAAPGGLTFLRARCEALCVRGATGKESPSLSVFRRDGRQILWVSDVAWSSDDGMIGVPVVFFRNTYCAVQ
jgi:hypothetical protein